MTDKSLDTEPKKKKKKRRIAGIILGIVLLLGIGGCAYLVSIGKIWDDNTQKFDSSTTDIDDFRSRYEQENNYSGELENSEGIDNTSDIDHNGNGIPDDVEGGQITDTPQETGSTDILLLGSDSRAGTAEAVTVSGQRADTIMLLHIPENGGDPYLISIMRDTWVNIPGYGSAKVNAGLNYGGVDLQVATIEQLVGIKIDHTAEIDFSGFKSMTDALGGVDVNVPVSFSSDNYTFTQGPMHLDGGQALEFVRQRYAFSDGDYQRVRNQRAFVRGLLTTVQSQGAFKNATNFKNVVEAIAPYVTVDSGLSAGEIVRIATPYITSGGANIHMLTLPNAGTGWSLDGQSIVVLDSTATAALKDSLRHETLGNYTAIYGED